MTKSVATKTNKRTGDWGGAHSFFQANYPNDTWNGSLKFNNFQEEMNEQGRAIKIDDNAKGSNAMFWLQLL